MNATVKITVSLSDGSTVEHSAEMGNDRAADFAAYAMSVYGKTTNDTGNEIQRTPQEAVSEWIKGTLKGGLANVQRFKEQEALKAVQSENLDDVVIS